MTFSPKDQKAIDAAVARLQIVHSVADNMLLVYKMSHGAWMLFWAFNPPEVVDNSDNIQYQTIMTGHENPPWWEINAAWILVRRALVDVSKIPRVRIQKKPNPITGTLARVMAAYFRVQEGNGFENEAQWVPGAIEDLTDAERAVLELRKAGKPIELPEIEMQEWYGLNVSPSK